MSELIIAIGEARIAEIIEMQSLDGLERREGRSREEGKSPDFWFKGEA